MSDPPRRDGDSPFDVAGQQRSDGGVRAEVPSSPAVEIETAPTVPGRLRSEWRLIASCFLLVTGGIGAWALPALGVRTALAWTGGTLAIGAGQLWFLRARLSNNRSAGVVADKDETPARSLGIANVVTLVRGWLVAAVGGFALVEPTAAIVWVPALAYSAGAGLDWVDGAVARTVGRRTVLGADLDMAFDTLGFVVAPVVAVLWGRLPIWYLSLSAARYLFRAGVVARHLRARPVYDLPSSIVRRPLAGVQMAFLAVALAPLIPAATVGAVAPIVLVPSLAVFLRDYLAVSGRL
jgi:CDP-diacylglycerol--glycerol-3-phosphate 3-phosphatidyltransferase